MASITNRKENIMLFIGLIHLMEKKTKMGAM